MFSDSVLKCLAKLLPSSFCCKSGKIWLETSATDYWTLEQQNEEGKSLAKHFKTESENINDIDPY